MTEREIVREMKRYPMPTGYRVVLNAAGKQMTVIWVNNEMLYFDNGWGLVNMQRHSAPRAWGKRYFADERHKNLAEQLRCLRAIAKAERVIERERKRLAELEDECA